MNDNSRLKCLLEKYLDNICSESEMAELLELFKRAKNEPEIKQILDNYWKRISDADISSDEFVVADHDSLFEDILSKSNQQVEGIESGQQRKNTVLWKDLHRSTHQHIRWVKVAAVAVITVCLTLFYFTISEDYTTDQPVAYEQRSPGPGEKMRFTLSDGTQVHLNSESRLVYPASFNGSVRDVQLEGEAYFVVASEEDQPFRVQTGEVSTTVLGTSFNVRSYPDEKEVTVAVTSGKVVMAGQEASGENQEVILEANQWANYSHSAQNFSSGSEDISALTAWNEGVLLYHDETLEYVVSQLERWYGVTINFENEVLKNCVIRGEHRDESLVNVLNAITFAFNMEYEIQDRRVTLMGEGCS